MENKYLLIIAGSVVFLLLVASIIYAVVRRGGGEEQQQTTDPVTITIWRLFDEEDAFQPIFDQYKSDHPNVTIVYEKKDVADYEEVFTNAIAGGKGPDILSLPNDWLVKHKDKLIAAPETVMKLEEYQEQFVEIANNDAVIDNQIYGMPLYTDSLALYYNSEITGDALVRLREANPGGDLSAQQLLLTRPPTNWTDLIEAVKLITQRNGNDVTVAGIAMGTAETTLNSAAILQALMLQNGSTMTNVDRSAASFHLPSETQTGKQYFPGTEALDFFTAFAKTDRTVYNWNDRMGSSLEAFMNKKAAMMINFKYVQQDLRQRAPTLRFDVAPLPQIKGPTNPPANVASYMVETVTKDADNPDVAWGLVKHMANPSQVASYRTVTRRTSAIRRQVEGGSDPFAIGIENAKSVYKPDAKKYDDSFREMIRAVVDLRQPPQTAIDVAANKVTQLLLGQ